MPSEDENENQNPIPKKQTPKPHPLLKLTGGNPPVHRSEDGPTQPWEQLLLPGLFTWGFGPPADPAMRPVWRPKRYRRR